MYSFARRLLLAASSVLALMLAMSFTPATAVEGGATSWTEKAESLELIESFISYNEAGGYRTQILDDNAAKESGLSQEVVDLASEFVTFQNALMLRAFQSGNSDASQANVPLNDFPKVRDFFRDSTQNARMVLSNSSSKSGSPFGVGKVLAIAQPHPCGNFAYPVPNFTPTRYYFFNNNGESYFFSNGFHRTAAYATDIYPDDYTRDRGYQGPYGYCSSPRFRDQGQDFGSSYTRQNGEPNPEILGYWWPYWNWGAYVYWWHTAF